jgi:hypothetical protein
MNVPGGDDSFFKPDFFTGFAIIKGNVWPDFDRPIGYASIKRCLTVGFYILNLIMNFNEVQSSKTLSNQIFLIIMAWEAGRHEFLFSYWLVTINVIIKSKNVICWKENQYTVVPAFLKFGWYGLEVCKHNTSRPHK